LKHSPPPWSSPLKGEETEEGNPVLKGEEMRRSDMESGVSN